MDGPAGFESWYEAEIRPHLGRFEAARRLARRRTRSAIGLGAIGVALILSIGIVAPAGWTVPAMLTILGMGLCLVALALAVRAHRAAQAPYKDFLLPAVCRRFGLAYRRDGFDFPVEPFADLGLVPIEARHRLEDRMSGVHRGVGIDLCEADLRHGGRPRRRNRGSTFRGVVAMYTLPRPVDGTTVVVPDVTWLGNRLDGLRRAQARVPIDDAAFEDRFEVYADDPGAARALLTPERRAALLALAEEANPDIPKAFQKVPRLAFAGGTLFMALPRIGDSFEAAGTHGALGLAARYDDPARVEALVAEIALVLSVPARLGLEGSPDGSRIGDRRSYGTGR